MILQPIHIGQGTKNAPALLGWVKAYLPNQSQKKEEKCTLPVDVNPQRTQLHIWSNQWNMRKRKKKKPLSYI